MEYLNFPQIDSNNIILLWKSGPSEGVLEYNGQRYWYTQCDTFENYPKMFAQFKTGELMSWHWRFSIHELNPEQLKYLEGYQHFSMKYTGNMTGYHHVCNQVEDKYGPACGLIRPKHYWNEYCDNVKTQSSTDYKTNNIIGWFEV